MQFERILRPRRGWQPINFREIWMHRELLIFLIWRDVKIRYRQTLFGGLWAVFQPLAGMAVFTLLFNRLAHIGSDSVPYPIFAFAGLICWTLFANGVSLCSNSLIGNQQLISKIYFPRIFIPLGSIGALLLDLILNLFLMAGFMAYYRWPPSLNLMWLPLFLLLTLLTTCGIGFILSAMNVRFRDVKYVLPYLLQMWFFVTPVIYPNSFVPNRFQLLMALNPMTGVVSGFRHSLLGTEARWEFIALSSLISISLFVVGLFSFRRMETYFADVI
jgi:lipopolysaccharide transport system permease protein